MKKKIVSLLLLLCILCTSLLSACDNQGMGQPSESESNQSEFVATNALEAMQHINTHELNIIDDNYRNVYEIMPFSFCDGNGDKSGDIQGIISKLSYIKDLGFNAIWLTPVQPSPTYHKYDTTDYYDIDPDFGTMADYEQLIEECHKMGIDVYMDLVVNHTSNYHPWFTEMTDYLRTLVPGEIPSASDCKYINYYVLQKEGGSGFSKIAGTQYYYECQFWTGMPDLNLDSPIVRQEIDKIVKFWLDKGVDGFRLDAVTSYYTGNDEKNIEFLTWLNKCVKEKKPDAYIVGECWTNSVTYAKYYQSGVDSFFNFDFAIHSGTIANTLKFGSAKGYANKIVSIKDMIDANSSTAIDAGFTTNHDNDRLAGALPGAKGKLKMAQAMAMMIGGSYYLYYGDEIGMKGSGDDENKRAPMQWVEDPYGSGMCLGCTTKEIKHTNGTVASHLEDKDSLYYYVQQAVSIRNMFPEIARGETSVISECTNEDVVVLKKSYNGEELLIVMNISENANTVDLSNVSINGKEAGKFEVVGTLLDTAEMVGVEGSTLQMPGYSIEFVK